MDDGCSCKCNIFLSAPAGCEKFHILMTVLEPALVARYGKVGCITASTGLAAQALGGLTICSPAGMITGRGPAKQVADAMVESQEALGEGACDCDRGGENGWAQTFRTS